MYNNILIPVDFTDESIKSIQSATNFLKEGGKITLFHAIPDDLPAYLSFFEDMTFFADSSLVEAKLIEIRQKAEEKLSNLVSEFSKEGINIEAEIKDGKPYVEIIKKSADYDLVVLGLSEKNYGVSVSPMKVIRKALSDVLVIKGKKDIKQKRVLFPVDIREVSDKVLDKIKFFSQKSDVELYIVYVIEMMPFLEIEYLGSSDVIDFEGIKDKTLKTLEEKIKVENAKRAVLVGTGAADEINAFARSKEIDLVVMGHKRKSGFERTVLGSTSEKFVHISKIPTLIVK